MPIEIVKEKCPQNHKCPAARACSANALEQNGVSAPTVKMDKCTDCGKCVRVCPTGALVLIKETKK